MSYTVTYYCPRCGALVELDREGYLDDKSVTPYPLEGWQYAEPTESFDDADGVRFVCGDAAPGLSWLTPPDGASPVDGESATHTDGTSTTHADDGSSTTTGERSVTSADEFGGESGDGDTDTNPGCGEPFYLSFVRFENGSEVDPRGPSEQVELADSSGPSGPGGPRGPGGPSGFYE